MFSFLNSDICLLNKSTIKTDFFLDYSEIYSSLCRDGGWHRWLDSEAHFLHSAFIKERSLFLG